MPGDIVSAVKEQGISLVPTITMMVEINPLENLKDIYSVKAVWLKGRKIK